MSEELIIMPIPALVAVLLHGEREKGSPLTEAEVWAIRDAAHSVVTPVSVALEVAKGRGYDDIDPENAWEEWQAIRESFAPDQGNE